MPAALSVSSGSGGAASPVTPVAPKAMRSACCAWRRICNQSASTAWCSDTDTERGTKRPSRSSSPRTITLPSGPIGPCGSFARKACSARAMRRAVHSAPGRKPVAGVACA
jgi:hypothetical protein